MQGHCTSCPECPGRLRSDDGELVCGDCGIVVDRRNIDHGPEWRESADEDSDARRTGAPRTNARHDRGLSTEIGYGDGSDLSGDRQRQLVRMRRQHNRSRIASKADRNRVYAYTEIGRILSSLSLTDAIEEQACSLFDSAQDADLLCGRSLEGMAAAAVYATCRTRSVARTMGEIVAVSRADRDELKTAYNALNTELGLPVGPIDPVEYLPRYASELGVDTDTESLAREFVVVLVESGRMGGKNPSGVAAACLYAATRERGFDYNQRTLADLADVSRMTISSTVSDLEAVL
jgi:transcription initiation factor TFIIB